MLATATLKGAKRFVNHFGSILSSVPPEEPAQMTGFAPAQVKTDLVAS